ncbi:hypothetical protein AAG570_000964 [Ranatra chinensis]|uniref:mRNA guanylyltransferase n=1 Tax=Ranatra chinensis TaxID=642074 RepID=A0ABD0YAG3_9HEMI
MDGITGVQPVFDEDLLHKLDKSARQYCKFKGNVFPGSQPVSMDTENIKFIQTRPYRVSWKADGTRDNNFFKVHNLRFVQRDDLDKHIVNTLLDGEMVIDKHQGMSYPRYLVYDIVRINDVDVSTHAFYPHRLQYIENEIIKPRHSAIMGGKIDKSKEPFSIRAKIFYPVEKAKSFLSEKFSNQLGHEPDGLIFQPSEDPYKAGQCIEVLKWKPPSHNSVDFRLKIALETGEGILRRKVGQLFVGGYDPPFATMRCTRDIKELDNKIIECRLENDNWVFMRERTDKSFPNRVETAWSVYNSIKNPITKEFLLDFIERYRYRSDDDMMPPPPRPSNRR